jgi:hypothetical protein
MRCVTITDRVRFPSTRDIISGVQRDTYKYRHVPAISIVCLSNAGMAPDPNAAWQRHWSVWLRDHRLSTQLGLLTDNALLGVTDLSLLKMKIPASAHLPSFSSESIRLKRTSISLFRNAWNCYFKRWLSTGQRLKRCYNDPRRTSLITFLCLKSDSGQLSSALMCLYEGFHSDPGTSEASWTVITEMVNRLADSSDCWRG